MIQISTNELKLRRAREYCRIQSKGTAWDWRVDERRVINNKPHITLTAAEITRPAPPYLTMGAPVYMMASLADEMEEDVCAGMGTF